MKNVNILRVNLTADPNDSIERIKSNWVCNPDRFVHADYVAAVETGVNKIFRVYKINHDADTLYTAKRSKVGSRYQTRCVFDCLEEVDDEISKALLGMSYRPGRTPIVYEQFDEETSEFTK